LEGGSLQPAPSMHADGGRSAALLTPEMGLDRSKSTGSRPQRAQRSSRCPSQGPELGSIAASSWRGHLKNRVIRGALSKFTDAPCSAC
jgi:hypothetical protein